MKKQVLRVISILMMMSMLVVGCGVSDADADTQQEGTSTQKEENSQSGVTNTEEQGENTEVEATESEATESETTEVETETEEKEESTTPTPPADNSASNNTQSQDVYPYDKRYNIFTGMTPATEAEINAYTYTEMNEIWYPTNRIVFWRLPKDRTDFEFYSDSSNYMGWAMKFVPIKVTGVCNENGAYRVVMDGKTFFIPKAEGSFGEEQFVKALPAATKTNPKYEVGSAQWHAYWDGTRIDNFYMSTGEDLWITIKDANGALLYSGSYPNGYVIGSYADITVLGTTVKGQY